MDHPPRDGAVYNARRNMSAHLSTHDLLVIVGYFGAALAMTTVRSVLDAWWALASPNSAPISEETES